MERRGRGFARCVLLAAMAIGVAACGGGGGGAAAPDTGAGPDAAEDTAADGAAVDTPPGDVGGTVSCERDDDCVGALGALGVCQQAICDTVSAVCVVGRRPDKTRCDDGDPCTVGSECADGVCESGAAYDCDDGDPCTADVCDGEGGCTHPPAEAGTPCDDGNACTTDDACLESGRCEGSDDGTCECGADADCAAFDDGDACNGELVCDDGRCRVAPDSIVVCDTAGDTICARTRCVPETGACVRSPAADGIACDDRDPCTQDDACAEGVCVGVAGSCACESDADCEGYDDDDRCNGVMVCSEGACSIDPSTRVTCEDTTPGDCLVAACEPATGECHEAPAAAGTACEDGDACTEGSVCDEAGGCVGGEAISCDDGETCTDDTCDPATGCSHTPSEGGCDDGNACTEGDRCDGGQCVAGAPVDCDDGNACTDDACNAETGCVYTPADGRPCDDGDPCTGSEENPDHCEAGVCVGGEPCTCQEDADCAPLEDGDPCNGTLRCVDEQCVVDPGTVVVCPSDGDTTCRQSRCQPETGLCELESVADGVLCDDGDPCTTADSCQAGVCTPGAPLACDDGDDCTADACVDGACVHEPVIGAGCGCETADDCTDDDPCTRDACGPDARCTNTPLPDGSACEDGDPCTGGDQCQGGTCGAGSTPLCGGACNPAGTLACGDVVSAATWDFEATLFMSAYPCLAGDFSGSEMAYVFVAQTAQTVTASLADEPGLALLVLRAEGGGCDPLRCVSGDAAGGPVSWTVEPGETWFLVVDGANGAGGAFDLAVSCGSGEDCGNLVDDDGDGATDCADPECATAAGCRESACANGADDDGDGATDCADTDCAAEAVCLPEADCDDGRDDDEDGDTDCADGDCAADPVCIPEPDCTDGVDEDLDGLTDCADPDCRQNPACIESDCDNLVDDDGDGETDCVDDDCDGQPGCIESSCSNGLDDDRDGDTDCRDGDCDGSDECVEVLCDDGLDNERDGLVDCDDPDCFAEWPCSALCLPAVEVRCGEVAQGQTAGAALAFDDYGECLATRSLGGPEQIFAFLAPRNGVVTFTLFDADFDAAMLLLENVCRPPLACADGVDAAGGQGTEVLRFYANVGEAYFVAVDGVDGDEGTFSLALGCQGQPERICDNGVDEDGDGRVDCADSDCLAIPPCAEADCNDGVDDNGDGLVDCADPSCVEDPTCGEFDCTNQQDDDGDELVDCADEECFLHPSCGERCDNGVDDDDDGAADCADPDCVVDPACAENCTNGVDDEGDGLADCADPECVAAPGCAELVCADGVDDDGDGATDCDDLDCVGVAACRESDCANGVDDDDDGITDCRDPDCRADASCFEIACGNGVDDDDDGATDCGDRDCGASGACAGEVCRPVRPLGCGETLTVDLRDAEASDAFDLWPTCDLFGFDHGGPELTYDLVAPCTGFLSVAATPTGAGSGFFDLFLLAGDVGCTEDACLDMAYGTAEGAELSFEAIEGERFRVVVDALDGYAGPVQVSLTCSCEPAIEVVCDDGADDDLDLAIDCADPDCADSPVCGTACRTRGAVACGDVVGGTLGGALSTDRLDAYPSCDRAGFDYRGAEDVWSFVAPCTGPVTVTTIRTAGSGTADTLVLRADATGACAAETCVAVGYMSQGGVGQVAFGAVAGARYFFAVDGADGAAPSYTLSATCGCLGETDCADTVDNDGDGAVDCLDADCAGTPACSGTGQCSPLRTLACDETVEGDTSVSQIDRVDAYGCSDLTEDGFEDVYRWVAPRTGLTAVFLDILGNHDLDLFVLEDLGGGCDPDACIAWSTRTGDETAPFVAVAGRTYYIVVDGYGQMMNGPYRVTVDCSPGCDVGGAASCEAPVDGDLGGAAATDLIGAYPCDGARDDYSGPEAIYALEAPCTGAIDVRVQKLFDEPGAVDLVWLARSAVCDGQCIDIAKMDAQSGAATMTLDVTEGQELLFAVDGRDGATGAFRIELDCDACLTTDPCYGAHATWCGATVSGTTADAENGIGFYGCSAVGWPGGDVHRTFLAESSGPVTLSLSTDGPLGAFVIERGPDGCDPFRCVAGGLLGPETDLTFDAVSGRRYVFVVDGAEADGAPFALDVECE